MNNNYLTPEEITKYVSEAGSKKIKMKKINTLILAVLAGWYVAIASVGTNQMVHTMTNGSLAKVFAGLLFPIALILILVSGGELFTGNTLTIVGCLDGKYKFNRIIKNLSLVFVGNLIGAIAVTFLIYKSGQFKMNNGLLGGYTIKAAVSKVSYSWEEAFYLGVLCNIVVSIAVWMSYAAKDIVGKVAVSFFAIWLFVASGYEHTVANMYYLSAGLVAKSNPTFVEKAINEFNLTPSKIEGLNITNILMKNIIPVTLGNFVGGALFIGTTYWFVYIKNNK